MYVRFVNWVRLIPPLTLILLFILMMDVLLFVHIVNGWGAGAFVLVIGIGLVAGLSATTAFADARTRRSIGELVRDQARSIDHYRQVASDAARELIAGREYLASRRASLDATLPGDVAEVLDSAHALALDWRDQATFKLGDGIGTGVFLTPDDLSELIAFLEIAMELVAPEPIDPQ